MKRVLLCIMDGWGIAKDSIKNATLVVEEVCTALINC